MLLYGYGLHVVISEVDVAGFEGISTSGASFRAGSLEKPKELTLSTISIERGYTMRRPVRDLRLPGEDAPCDHGLRSCHLAFLTCVEAYARS